MAETTETTVKPAAVQLAPRNTRGVINPQRVRVISFAVITVSLVVCTMLCILAIWGFNESDAVYRAIGTFIVVIIATAIFTVVNEKLG